MNMRKIIAMTAAVLMLFSVLPMSAFAAAGDVVLDMNFDNGVAGFERGYVENSYMVFDATTADWQNTYIYANSMKANTMYKLTFKAKANKEANLAFKINNNWTGDTFKESVAVTTEWQDFELIVNSGALTATALVMFASDYAAGAAPIYNIDDVKIVETVDPALIGKVVNGDFSDNTGWKLGSGATIANGVLKLENINQWSEAAMQTVPVKANTNYEITWKSQRVTGTGAFNMIVMNAASADLQVTSGQNWMSSTSTEWINHSITVNTGDSEVMIFKLTTESAGAKTILLDDIKLSEVKDPSFDGILYNGDFETGKILPWVNLWDSNTVEMVAGMDSDYALKGTGNSWTQVYQSVTVEPNTDYIVTAWAKDANQSALWVKSAGGAADVANKNFATGSDWQLNVLNFNSGSNTSMWIGLMSLTTGGTYTVDNVKVSKAVPASNDGYIVNGNFESGALTPWQLIWDSQIAGSIVDDGHESAFAVKAIGKAPWGQIRQKVAVEPNTNYKVTVWGKNVSKMALLIKDGNDSGNIVNQGINAGDEWTEFTVEFNSGNYDSVYVGVMVNEASSYGTFDDFKMECLHVCDFKPVETTPATCCEDGVATLTCECGKTNGTQAIPATGEHTYVYDCDKNCAVSGNETRPEAEHAYDDKYDADCNYCGSIREVPSRPVIEEEVQTSISEDVDGLAFKFDVNAANGAVHENTTTVYVKNSATIVVDGEEYQLKYIGAIATNKAGLAAEDLTFESAKADGKRIINIKATKLCALSADSLSFAIRITDIPDAQKDTDITVRPYFMYDGDDGKEVKVYGETVTASYNG